MPARDVHHWIDRWERNGLVDVELAQQLHADATRAGTAPVVPADPVDRVLAVARDGVVEALGYVGAALTIGTVVVLFDVPDWAAPALATLLFVAALAAGVGTWLLTPATTPTTRRLAGVLGAVAAACVAAGIAQALDPGDRVVDDAPGRDLVVAVPGLVVAGIMYARHRHLLTHAATGAAAVATCLGLADLLAGRDPASDVQDAVAGGLLAVVAVAWIMASERGVLEPAWLGTPVAGAVAYAGAAMATSWSIWSGSSNRAPVLASLAIAAVATVVGVTTSRLRVTIVGTAGLLVTVPMTFTEVFGWTGTATAGVLLPVGIAVTVWAVLAGRRPPAGA